MFIYAQLKIKLFVFVFRKQTTMAQLKIKLFVFVFRKQTTMAPFWKGDAMRYCATGNVDRSYFQQNKLLISFPHFCDIKS